MSEDAPDQRPEQLLGRIGWQDLTVGNAEQVRDFYSAVAGWQSQPLSMGDYDDYVMLSPDGESAVGGVCHARGVNARIPPVWMVYINVEDLDSSVARVTELGGEIVDGPREMGEGRFAVIRDPAGAVCGLIEP
ncbi:MAG: VOC family protein [Chloroflexota bacterium]|nr:VOC family protein [Chloroflexota bacterium]